MWLGWFFACTRPPDDPPRDGRPDPTESTAPAHTGTPTTPGPESGGSGADPTGHTAAPDACAAVPRTIAAGRRVSRVPPSEEFAFDGVGNVVNATESAGVFLTDYAGNSTALSPGGSWEYAGIRVAPDGASAALCDEAAGVVSRVDLATGTREQLLAIAGPNTVGWDAWGRLWIGANTQLIRFDPAVGTPEVITERPGADLDGLSFSPDGRSVYFDDDTGGDIGRVELDADGEVVGLSVYASLPGVFATGSELDGTATDVCGNLYVVRTNGEITRIWADGTVQILVAANGTWTTALRFGSGAGGWGRDQLYVMDRSRGLVELDVGVDGTPEPYFP